MSRHANIRADRTSLYLLFPPTPGTHGRASGITGLLANGSSAGVSYIGSNCLHIWWTTAIEWRARITVTIFNIVPLWSHMSVRKTLFWNQYSSTRKSRFLSPNNCSGVDIHYDTFLVQQFTIYCDEMLKCTCTATHNNYVKTKLELLINY